MGVAFKLCHALIKYGRDNGRDRADSVDLRDYLDWTAVGTIADMVPLLGGNRILVRHGLERLNKTESIGLQALIDVAGVNGRIDTYHVGFCIGPRLNAAGRLGSPQMALELLLTDDPQRARQIARQLDEANRERKEIESAIRHEAETVINTWFDPSSHFGLVVGKQGWHPGVIGIVASRLTAAYGCSVQVHRNRLFPYYG
ncbi:single-stranded-DNA-specific exonuclease RecJ, partial [Verrucomicrobiota bacterium]